MQRQTTRKFRAILLAAVPLTALGSSSLAAPLYWDSNGNATDSTYGGNGQWSAGDSNWNTSATIGSGALQGWTGGANDDAHFLRNTSGNVIVSGTQILKSINLGTSAGSFTTGVANYAISGGILDIRAASFATGVNNSLGNNSITSQLNFFSGVAAGASNNQRISATSSITLTLGNIHDVSGVSTGTHQLTLDAAGTTGALILGGNITKAANTVGITMLVGQGGANTATYTVSGNNTGLVFDQFVYHGSLVLNSATALAGAGRVNFFNAATMAASPDTARLLIGVSGVSINKTALVNALTSTDTNDVRTIGGSFTSGSSTWAGAVTLNAFAASGTGSRMEFTSAGTATVDFSGLIDDGANTVPIIKTGSGTVRLTRAAGNTYDGGTTVSVGTLIVNNTSNSATGSGNVAVSSGATLGGGYGAADGGTPSGGVYAANTKGIISGAVNINGGGHLAPGNSVGTITTGALTLNSGSVLDYEFTGSSNDFTQATTVSLTSGNGGGFNLFNENLASAYSTNGTYNLIGHSGALAGFTPGTQTGTGSSSASFNILNAQTNKKYTFSDTGSVIQLTISSLGPSIALSASVPTGFGNPLLDDSVAGGPADRGDFNPNSPANTLSVTGANGSYVPGYVNSINAGNGDSANYVDIAGFNPSTDAELFALNLLNNGAALVPGVSGDDLKIAQIIQDINSSNTGVLASAISPTGFQGQFAGYDILLTFANPGANGNGYFAFNFTGYSTTNISNVTVSDLAMVPEPASVTILAIGALALTSRRRRTR